MPHRFIPTHRKTLATIFNCLPTLILAAALASTGPAAAHHVEGDQQILHLHGDLRLIARDALTDARPYTGFAPGPDLWGIGLPEGVDGEFLVLGGDPFLGAFEDGLPAMSRTAPEALVFFAYAHIEDWLALPVPGHVTDFTTLTAFVEQAGRAYGFDPVAGFPFRLEGDVEAVDWFVVDGMGDLDPDPVTSFLAARHLGTLVSRRIDTFGTFSSDLEGVASIPGTPIHLHFATVDDGALFVGHVDNGIRLRPGATVHLPARLPSD